MGTPLVAVTMGISPGTGPTPVPRATLNEAYVHALVDAGCLPLPIPPQAGIAAARALLGRCQGLVLTGGPDIHPRRYGQQPDPSVDLATVSPERDEVEIELALHALAAGLPLLALCRGAQVLNVAAGGTLVQDIPSTHRGSNHRQQGPRSAATHAIAINPGSRLAAALGTVVARVNTLHHQAIDAVGDGIRVVARSPDGVIEGIEVAAAAWAIGVQWHPEEMASEAPHARALFSAFTTACDR